MLLEDVVIVRLNHFKEEEQKAISAHVLCLVLVTGKPRKGEFSHTCAHVLQPLSVLGQSGIAMAATESICVSFGVELVDYPDCRCQSSRSFGFLPASRQEDLMDSLKGLKGLRSRDKISWGRKHPKEDLRAENRSKQHACPSWRRFSENFIIWQASS